MGKASALLKRFGAHVTIATTIAFIAVFVLFAASLTAYEVIPKYGPWGFDLQNLWVFHNCAVKNAPYGVPGSVCKDFAGRPMQYPPALYWSFVWLRVMSFATARWIWAGAIAVIVMFAPLVWSDTKTPLARIPERAPLLLLGAALVTQFPSEFAIERGNNDVIVLAVMSAAVVLAERERHFSAGILVGLSTALKVYPAFTAFVIGIGMIGAATRKGRAGWLAFLRFGAGAAAAFFAFALVFLHDTLLYFREVLPKFAKECPSPQVCAHSLPANFPDSALWLSAGVILIWCLAAFHRYENSKAFVFAGAMAVSTYVARTSYDYNLVTAYPLLMVLGATVLLRPQRRLITPELLLLGLGLLAIVAQRKWFSDMITFHVELQLAWLAGTAALVAIGMRDAPVVQTIRSPFSRLRRRPHDGRRRARS